MENNMKRSKVKATKAKDGKGFYAEFSINGDKYVIVWEAIDDRELSVKFNIGIQQIIEEVEEADGFSESANDQNKDA